MWGFNPSLQCRLIPKYYWIHLPAEFTRNPRANFIFIHNLRSACAVLPLCSPFPCMMSCKLERFSQEGVSRASIKHCGNHPKCSRYPVIARQPQRCNTSRGQDGDLLVISCRIWRNCCHRTVTRLGSLNNGTNQQ